MSNQVLDRNTLASEASCLASMIMDNTHIPAVFELLTPEEFLHNETELIYRTIRTLWTSDEFEASYIDVVMVMDLLKKRRLWSEHMREILIGAMDSLQSADNCMYHAKRVKDCSEERNVGAAISEAEKTINDSAMSIEDKRAAIASVFAKVTQTQTDSNMIPVHNKAFGLVDLIKSKQMGITTGFLSLDRKLYGISPGEIVILAGRPSMGKSSLMLDMALAAAKAGKKVLIFSLEMSYDSVIERIMVNLSKVWLNTIRGDWETPEEQIRLSDAENQIANMKLWVKASPSLKPIDVYSTAKLMASQYGVDVIFIDYMQLMQPNTRKENRQQEVSSISMELKAAAMMLSIPIVVLSQLNRATEGRSNTRPKLSDLRESGSIEQDAHKIVLLHREDYYKQRNDPDYVGDGEASCIIAKNRQGPCGEVQLMWVPEEFSFMEPKDGEEEKAKRPEQPADAQKESVGLIF